MLQDLFVYGNTAWVSSKFLMDRKVPLQTIYNHTSKKCKKPWFTKNHLTNDRNILIEYSSIPIEIINKYNLPQFAELKDLAEVNNQIFKNALKDKSYKTVCNILDFEYNNWESLRYIYANEFLDGEKIEMYCKTHILLSKIIELNELGFKLIDLYYSYCQYDGLVFKNCRYRSFCDKIRKIKKSNCIEDILLHGLKNRLSNYRKITEDIILLIKNSFYKSTKPNAKHILDIVNDYLVRQNRPKISLPSIYGVISKMNVKNEAMISRFGEQYAKNKMLPFAHFSPPQSEGILWMMDGTRLQFAYKDGPDKFNYLIFYVVLDVYNKKIVGYSVDESENSVMALRAFRNACDNTKYLPREIIGDNSSSYRVKEYVRITAHAKLLGVNWRIIKSGNPRDNSNVERCFGVLQERFCKKYEGYLGDGISSRNLNGRPSPEELKKNLSRKNLRTKVELIDLIDKIINEYNESKDREELMRKDIFAKKMAGNQNIEPIPLNSINYAILFFSSKELTVQNGMVSFSLNKKTFVYNIYDADILINYHGTKVRVRYNENDPSIAMLFELESDKYICTLEKFEIIPKALLERSLEDTKNFNDHSDKFKALKSNLKSRVKQIEDSANKILENTPPEISQVIPVSKSLREKSETEAINSELEKHSKVEKLDLFIPEYKDKALDEIFEDTFLQKGNLKTYKNGKN